jgi:hypothetical protein
MPTYKSDKGIWTPAKERSVLPADEGKNRPEAQIYEGEDRAARAVLNEEKVDHLGMPVEQDPEVIYRARQMNMTVPEFLKLHEPPTPQAKAVEDKKKTFVQTHPQEKPKPGVKPQGGRSPERPENEGGAFGDPPAAVTPVQS